MTVWMVLLIVLLALWLISLIRVGGRVRYGKAGLFAAALVGPFKIQILPMRPKKEKKPKKERKPRKKKPARPPKEPPAGQPGTLARVRQMLPVIAEFCGALKRKIRIDDLELQLVWGGRDPAAIALGYGQANAVLGMLWPVFDHNFKVKRHSFQIGMDYGAPQPTVEIEAAVTLTVGQIMILGLRCGVKVLTTWVKSGRPAGKRQEALSHE